MRCPAGGNANSFTIMVKITSCDPCRLIMEKCWYCVSCSEGSPCRYPPSRIPRALVRGMCGIVGHRQPQVNGRSIWRGLLERYSRDSGRLVVNEPRSAPPARPARRSELARAAVSVEIAGSEAAEKAVRLPGWPSAGIGEAHRKFFEDSVELRGSR